MRLRLTFGHTAEEHFLVTAGLPTNAKDPANGSFAVTNYDHEDVFLGLLMSMDLSDRDLYDAVHAVLMTVSKPVFPQRWVELDLTQEQVWTLDLKVPGLVPHMN